MLLKDVHPDIPRYLEQDCYCPNEVYSVDGFTYLYVYEDAPCKVVGTYRDRHDEEEQITLVITASGSEFDHPILLNIWHTDSKVTGMERYEYSEDNLKNIQGYLDGSIGIQDVVLTEAQDLAKILEEIRGFSMVAMFD